MIGDGPGPESRNVWFWQRQLTPHMTALAAALAARGCAVDFVAEEEVSDERRALGWAPGALPGVRTSLVRSEQDVQRLLATAAPDSVHICQGIRANGLVSCAQSILAARKLRQWVIVETVRDGGLRGVLRRFLYRRIVARRLPDLQGFLAIGAKTSRWLVERGCPAQRVFPFTYFLQAPSTPPAAASPAAQPRVVFVGSFVFGKGLDLLIDALARPQLQHMHLVAIGAGALEDRLRAAAETALPGRVDWVGRLAMQDVGPRIASADCLVLPSRHDGWGAVITEALLAGTPAICSDACGASEAVRASGYGAVVPSGNADALAGALQATLARRLSGDERKGLSAWAANLAAPAGAQYLEAIFDHVDGHAPRPAVPWRIA